MIIFTKIDTYSFHNEITEEKHWNMKVWESIHICVHIFQPLDGDVW